MNENFEKGQKIANQEIDNKYKNNPFMNGGPGSGVKGHTTAGKEGKFEKGSGTKSTTDKPDVAYDRETGKDELKPEFGEKATLGTTDVNNFKGGSINFHTETRPKAGERNVVTVSATEKGHYGSRRWVSKPGRKLTGNNWNEIQRYKLGLTKPETTAHISEN